MTCWDCAGFGWCEIVPYCLDDEVYVTDYTYMTPGWCEISVNHTCADGEHWVYDPSGYSTGWCEYLPQCGENEYWVPLENGTITEGWCEYVSPCGDKE